MHHAILPISSAQENLDKGATSTGAANANSEKLDWGNAQSIGVYNHCLPRTASPTCGKLLAHCKSKVDAFREKMGVRVTIFKIGCTACPVTRFDMYKKHFFQ